MEIKLSIKQDDIEQAIKDFVVSKGITTPVREINFQVARKGGFSLTADVEVSEMPLEPKAETSEPKSQDTEAKQPAEEPKTKPAAKQTKPAEKSKPASKQETPEPVAEEKEPEPAKTEPPFTPDAKEESANDGETVAEQEAPKTQSKSLFG